MRLKQALRVSPGNVAAAPTMVAMALSASKNPLTRASKPPLEDKGIGQSHY
jgi:hypothetical protein